VFDGDPAPPQKGAEPSIFGIESIGRTVLQTVAQKGFAQCYRTVVCPVLSVTLVYCGQTAGWMKMALGTEVGLGKGHIVLDGDLASLSKNRDRAPPIFGPFLSWPNGWMHQDATWYGGRPQPMRLFVRWGPSPTPFPKRGRVPNFRPTSIVAKRLHG